MRRMWRANGLSITLALLFAVSWGGQVLAGHREYNHEQRLHGASAVTLSAYLRTPDFLEATAENWESEFLQMALYVMLTAVLYQRGSAESKDPDQPSEQDRVADPQRADAPWPVRRGGIALFWYKRSLSLAFALLFLFSMTAHAIGGAGAANADAEAHGISPRTSAWAYLRSARFWFESLQNWQSEFLAMLSIVTLSIWLRQEGSPESKPVDAPHHTTSSR